MDEFGNPIVGNLENDGAGGIAPYGAPTAVAVPAWALVAVVHMVVAAATYVGYLAIAYYQYGVTES